MQVGRSKKLTPLSDPLIGVEAGPVTVVLEECFLCSKIWCVEVMAVPEQVFRQTLRSISDEENESRGLTAL